MVFMAHLEMKGRNWDVHLCLSTVFRLRHAAQVVPDFWKNVETARILPLEREWQVSAVARLSGIVIFGWHSVSGLRPLPLEPT